MCVCVVDGKEHLTEKAGSHILECWIYTICCYCCCCNENANSQNNTKSRRKKKQKTLLIVYGYCCCVIRILFLASWPSPPSTKMILAYFSPCMLFFFSVWLMCEMVSGIHRMYANNKPATFSDINQMFYLGNGKI